MVPTIRRLFPALAYFALLGVLAPFPAVAEVEAYDIDPVHSTVQFKIRHLVSYVTGRFAKFQGTIEVDREDMTRSKVSLSIDPASIDTGVERRDNHLRSSDFFDVENYPEMRFVSTNVRRLGDNRYEVTGSFTMHGVTRTVTAPVEVLGFTSHPRFGHRAGFATQFTLDREDYEIKWNAPMGADSLVLGREVKVEINIEAVQREAETEEETPTRDTSAAEAD